MPVPTPASIKKFHDQKTQEVNSKLNAMVSSEPMHLNERQKPNYKRVHASSKTPGLSSSPLSGQKPSQRVTSNPPATPEQRKRSRERTMAKKEAERAKLIESIEAKLTIPPAEASATTAPEPQKTKRVSSSKSSGSRLIKNPYEDVGLKQYPFAGLDKILKENR